MATPAAITVAITGSIPTKADNPAVPVTPGEQVASAVEAIDAGATIVHVHVRDDHQRPSSDVDRYRTVYDGIKHQRPDAIVQLSTGGRGRSPDERFSCLEIRPEMASLSTGSVNFATSVYENPPQLVEQQAARMLDLGIKPEIEIFDFAMLYSCVDLLKRGLLAPPPHVQLSELRDLIPDATWTCAAIGRFQLEANRWALRRGGHVRTGLEDNIYYEKGRLAQSNAELVARLADLCAEYDRYPASPPETRHLLHLNQTTESATTF